MPAAQKRVKEHGLSISLEKPESAVGQMLSRRLVPMAGLLLGATLGVLIAVHSTRALFVFVGACVAGVVFWRPYVGFLLVVATIPIDVTGVIGGGAFGNLTVTKIVGGLTLLATVLDLLVRRRLPQWERFLTLETAAAVVLLTIAVLSAGIHLTAESASEVLRMGFILVFVFVAIHFVDRPARFRHVLLTLAIAGTLIAAHSVFQRFSRPASVSLEWVAQAGAVLDVSEERLGQMLRTTGTFSHPGWLGLFLSITVPLTLGVAWTARRRWLVAVGLGAAVIQVLGVFSTYSRMAYVGAGLGVVLFVLRRRFGPACAALLVAVSVVLFPALPEDFRARAHSILDYTESSSSLTRIGQQIAGWRMFRDHFALGVGPGNFETEVLFYADRVGEPYRVVSIGAHNMYVELAAELGVFGVLVVTCLLASCWYQARRRRRDAASAGERRDAVHWECVGVAFWVFMVSAMFVHAQHRKEWWLLVALIAAGRAFASLRERARETAP